MHPLTFSEGFAIAAGLVQLFVAVVFLRFRHGRPEWGLGWWASTFAAAGVMNTGAPVLLAAMHSPFGTSLNVLTMVLGISTMGALVAGGRLYTGHPRPGPWWSFALTWLAYLSLMMTRQLWPGYESLIANGVTGLIFAYLGCLSLGAMRREPGAGHGIAAAMLCLYIPMVAGAYAMGLDQVELRYWSAVPFALAGLGVTSATMGRMRAHLRDLNESLEQRVIDRTRELRDIIASLESFNSMVSHDLRGPLGGMAGLSGVALSALEAGDTERARRLFLAVQQQSSNLSELVSDLLSLARVSNAELRKQPVALDALVRQSMQQLELSHGEGHARPVQAEPLPVVNGDQALLRQALINLLGNALKFSRRAARPEVRVWAEPHDGGVKVAVKDNGVGFDAARRADLFSPFKRLHDDRDFEGTGLGLTLVQRIVERHGGRVGAESQAGQGATFWFWLPATETAT